MIKDFSQLFQIGKDLGLNKKEIKNVFSVGDAKYLKLAVIVIILMFVFFFAYTAITMISANYVHDTTYASGTYYSTVKKKDFKRRKRN